MLRLKNNACGGEDFIWHTRVIVCRVKFGSNTTLERLKFELYRDKFCLARVGFYGLELLIQHVVFVAFGLLPQGINRRGVEISRYRFCNRLVLRKIRV